MSYSNPYTPQPLLKPKRPSFLSMLAGFGISIVAGTIFGLFCSTVYSLIGQSGGLECLTVPMVIVILGGSTALSFFVTRMIHNKSRSR
ncbi:MAG: hypothetical protein NTZ74_00580 [Chloroflexi bacterium]|nr:hypothetical protein [Chloroflexota bacterium]